MLNLFSKIANVKHRSKRTTLALIETGGKKLTGFTMISNIVTAAAVTSIVVQSIHTHTIRTWVGCTVINILIKHLGSYHINFSSIMIVMIRTLIQNLKSVTPQ